MTTVGNPRLAAYCRAVGIPATTEAVRERDGNYAEFIVWSQGQMRDWQKARGLKRMPINDAEHADFTTFCDAAAEGGAS